MTDEYVLSRTASEIDKAIENALSMPSGGSGGVTSWNNLTDKPFDYTKGNVIFEKSYTLGPMDGVGGCEVTDIVSLAMGNTYVISFAGVEYCLKYKSFNGVFSYLGNLKFIGMTDNGVPFLFAPASEAGSGGIFGSEAGTFDFAIYEATATKKLSDALVEVPLATANSVGGVFPYEVVEESSVSWSDVVPVRMANLSGGLFVDPEDLPTTSGLPEVTTENNNQILGVSEGAWTVMDAPSGLPEVTTEDEGAFLRIVDGVATWVVLENAEDGAY